MADPILTAKNISFAYSTDKPTLHDISLSLDPGQILAILGGPIFLLLLWRTRRRNEVSA